ncbi:hypothetical protein ACFQBY_05825 [Promicromonospora citrea]|uniref:Uncharacterized protein n=2 Tax=Promicromonospora citrea TaxID=43677 RepID=A0A8H9GE34_9MICO|nr:hypothetical protein [Promicromonospora citrea]GGM14382.1 hypothetical protein GCM10010102_07300 [Promicromonospora citrea]
MSQAAQVGTVYRTSQDLRDADLPPLSVALDASGYAVQRDTDGNWYSVASVSASDLVGTYTLVHVPAEPLPAAYGSVVITASGTPFMRRWDAATDDHFQPECWIGPDGVTVTDVALRGLGIARVWDAGAEPGSRPGTRYPQAGSSAARPPATRRPATGVPADESAPDASRAPGDAAPANGLPSGATPGRRFAARPAAGPDAYDGPAYDGPAYDGPAYDSPAYDNRTRRGRATSGGPRHA